MFTGLNVPRISSLIKGCLNLSKASIRNYCDSLNQFFDYLLYVDSFGQTLSSVKDISRDKHIAFKSLESEKTRRHSNLLREKTLGEIRAESHFPSQSLS